DRAEFPRRAIAQGDDKFAVPVDRRASHAHTIRPIAPRCAVLADYPAKIACRAVRQGDDQFAVAVDDRPGHADAISPVAAINTVTAILARIALIAFLTLRPRRAVLRQRNRGKEFVNPLLEYRQNVLH